MISPSDFNWPSSDLDVRLDTEHRTEEEPRPGSTRPKRIEDAGRSHDHHWAVFLAISGQFRGRLWALFHGRRQRHAEQHRGAPIGVRLRRHRFTAPNSLLEPSTDHEIEEGRKSARGFPVVPALF